jgi:hypothetical protein
VVLSDVNKLHCKMGELESLEVDRAGVKRSAVTWTPSVMPPVSQMTKCLEKWRSEMGVDFDKAAYILEGIQHGFLITDCFLDIVSSRRANYKSTFLPEAICSVEKQIKLEMELGRYVICENIPYIISSMGAIPKADSRVRLIHDLSQPDGGPNKLAVDTSVTYATIDDAVQLIVPGTFLGK